MAVYLKTEQEKPSKDKHRKSKQCSVRDAVWQQAVATGAQLRTAEQNIDKEGRAESSA